MRKEPMIGIVIDETPHDLLPTPIGIKFELRVGYKEPGKMFLTTPSIRNAIILSRTPAQTRVGSVTVGINDSTKTIGTFFWDPTQRINSEMFKKIGLANILELQIEKTLAKKYPNYSITTGTHPSDKRILQITQRKRKVGEPIPIQEAIKLTRAQVIDQYQKNKENVAELIRQENKRNASQHPIKRFFKQIRERLKPKFRHR